MFSNYVHLVYLLTLLWPAVVQAASCDVQKQTFAKLNKQIAFEENTDAKSAANAYIKLAEPITEQPRNLVDQQIIDQLRADEFPQPANVVKRVRCLQSGISEYALFNKEGCDPVAFNARLGTQLGLAVAFDIFRGGIGAPDLRPYLEVFQNDGSRWKLTGSVGADFTGHSLRVQPLQAGKPGELWFLLWGARLGMGNAPLHLVVAAYDGTSVKEIWTRDLASAPLVEQISGDRITLSGEENNRKGRAQDFVEVYKVVPEGLALSSRRITKVY
jgi:hypothetical protein